jgi:hypothetical protein
MRKWLLVASVATLGSTGCAYGTPTPQFATSVPKFSNVDVDASEVVLHDEGADLAPDEAETARKELADLFEGSTRDRPAGDTPARFRAKVTLGSKRFVTYLAFGGCAAAGLVVLSPFTCGIYVLAGGIGGARSAHVEIAFETPAGTVTGEGDGYGSSSLYANSRRRALAEALERAMANATLKKTASK